MSPREVVGWLRVHAWQIVVMVVAGSAAWTNIKRDHAEIRAEIHTVLILVCQDHQGDSQCKAAMLP